ncbi:hypothetical protein DIPPA_35116 [Diplonema papillatum]|nr:hypothetical protein DIPPA_35116 [Diplonema papillatum]
MARWIQAAALLLASAVGAGAEEWQPIVTYHYTLRIQDRVAGVMEQGYSKAHKPSGDLFRATEGMHAEVQRGKDTTQLDFDTFFVETASGEPLKMGYSQLMAQDEIKMEYDFAGDAVAITSQKKGQEPMVTEGAKTTEVVIGKTQVQRLLKKEFLARTSDELVVSYKTMKPEMGFEPVQVTSTLTAVEEGDVLGERKTISKWKTDVVNLNLVSTEWYAFDEAHDMAIMIYYSVNSALGNLEATLATKEGADEAMSAEDKRPELVHSTYIPMDLGFKEAKERLFRDSGYQQYFVSSKDGSRPPILDTGYQRVAPVEGRPDMVRVTVDMNDAEHGQADVGDQKYLKPSAMIDFDHPEVQALAAMVWKDQKNFYGPPTVFQLVYSSIRVTGFAIQNSTLATGFASASETARTKSGDCSENAVLLAALLRAIGIPSRTVSGLVYIEDANFSPNMGWHMWTQALIPKTAADYVAVDTDRYWVDVDATLISLGRLHTVGHIALGTSAMTDAEGHAAELKLVNMIGNLAIQVGEGSDIHKPDYNAMP